MYQLIPLRSGIVAIAAVAASPAMASEAALPATPNEILEAARASDWTEIKDGVDVCKAPLPIRAVGGTTKRVGM